MKYLGLLFILVLVGFLYFFNQNTVVITREGYSFKAPKNWIVSDQLVREGCVFDGISNDTSDGHRLAGEIGIYSCIDEGGELSVTKEGYYIAAYYDSESMTKTEIEETKKAFEIVIDSFIVK